ncbi:hypothetical protein DFJ74DRAFT_418262 [Hyaloraphidium curvatum]|nr:hypothetical protein DFJ74DRAFT_418262 [Hyaloraphidium curvatum]
MASPGVRATRRSLALAGKENAEANAVPGGAPPPAEGKPAAPAPAPLPADPAADSTQDTAGSAETAVEMLFEPADAEGAAADGEIPPPPPAKRPTTLFDSGSDSELSVHTDSDDEREARAKRHAEKRRRADSPPPKPREDVWKMCTPSPLMLKKEEAGGYVRAGLYSADFKAGNGVQPAQKEEEPATRSGRPRAAPAPVRSCPSEPFKFGLPVHWGLVLLETEREFELAYDLLDMNEQVGINGTTGIDEIRIAVNYVPPSRYEKIRRNIFLERKPNNEAWPPCMCTPPDDGSPGCLDDCINRATWVECNPKTCPCGSRCSNQRFQRGERVKELEVCYTLDRGHGLKTLVPLSPGQLIVEYRGEVISEDTMLDRMASDPRAIYFLAYEEGEVIDACRRGSEARFVNHSCEPNTHIEKWRVNGEFCVGVFASRAIPAGAELTYDYKFESVGEMLQCRCGAARCRGFIGENSRAEGEDPRRGKRGGKAAEAGKPKKKVVDHERIWWLRKQKRNMRAMEQVLMVPLPGEPKFSASKPAPPPGPPRVRRPLREVFPGKHGRGVLAGLFPAPEGYVAPRKGKGARR